MEHRSILLVLAVSIFRNVFVHKQIFSRRIHIHTNSQDKWRKITTIQIVSKHN